KLISGSFTVDVVIIDTPIKGISKGVLVTDVAVAVACASLISSLLTVVIKKRHEKYKQSNGTCTQNFSSSSVVGRGGYGKFYKGILGDGQWYLLNVQKKDRYKMLVYEFSSRGTLRDWLNRMKLLRLEILNFTGILYLRTEANPPIFHRDNKTSNILIDSKLNAKVADLGLSRLGPNYVSTVVRGTPGYLDPKFLSTHKLTRESDVYSLGVVLLEILTNMKPILHGKNSVREVHQMMRMNGFDPYSDKKMNAEYERLFSKTYSYVDRISHLSEKPVQDLLKLHPAPPPKDAPKAGSGGIAFAPKLVRAAEVAGSKDTVSREFSKSKTGPSLQDPVSEHASGGSKAPPSKKT
ncbi:probable LRR receptor-like serine/threonine-protein kinase isoform X1, partial [Tanacetum coccineum]